MIYPSKMNKRKYDLIIGVDPDTKKSGVVELDTHTHEMDIKCLTLCEAMQYFETLQAKCELLNKSVLVVLESARLIGKVNWHGYGVGRTANAKGYDVGRNHQVEISLKEIAEHYGLETLERTPLKKYWSGNDRKITHDEFCEVTGCKLKRTNQEERDAGLLAWVVAELPIIIKRRRVLK